LVESAARLSERVSESCPLEKDRIVRPAESRTSTVIVWLADRFLELGGVFLHHR